MKTEVWKEICYATIKYKKAGMPMWTLDEINFNTRNMTRDKQGHFIEIKSPTQMKDTKLPKVYALKSSFRICEVQLTKLKWEKIRETNPKLHLEDLICLFWKLIKHLDKNQ